MKYCKKPVIIEATQWFKNGDHPEDGSAEMEGKIVRYFRRPDIAGDSFCRHCGKEMRHHGWIDTLDGGHIVCPGDFVITEVNGEKYPCRPDIFEQIYEHVDLVKQNSSKAEIVDVLNKILKTYRSVILLKYQDPMGPRIPQLHRDLIDEGEAMLKKVKGELNA